MTYRIWTVLVGAFFIAAGVTYGYILHAYGLSAMISALVAGFFAGVFRDLWRMGPKP